LTSILLVGIAVEVVLVHDVGENCSEVGLLDKEAEVALGWRLLVVLVGHCPLLPLTLAGAEH
jgi:hypothetical protein